MTDLEFPTAISYCCLPASTAASDGGGRGGEDAADAADAAATAKAGGAQRRRANKRSISYGGVRSRHQNFRSEVAEDEARRTASLFRTSVLFLLFWQSETFQKSKFRGVP